MCMKKFNAEKIFSDKHLCLEHSHILGNSTMKFFRVLGGGEGEGIFAAKFLFIQLGGEFGFLSSE